MAKQAFPTTIYQKLIYFARLFTICSPCFTYLQFPKDWFRHLFCEPFVSLSVVLFASMYFYAVCRAIAFGQVAFAYNHYMNNDKEIYHNGIFTLSSTTSGNHPRNRK